ncbi:hypothetical protein [Actinomadura hibisca]|uniref:hypothetical protein n=1 Tax=Actinomadura hibisca TaxID=68565 RepID=UPI0012FA3D57|nr:hypothetical protein [Actinomadura hibisca]
MGGDSGVGGAAGDDLSDVLWGAGALLAGVGLVVFSVIKIWSLFRSDDRDVLWTDLVVQAVTLAVVVELIATAIGVLRTAELLSG